MHGATGPDSLQRFLFERARVRGELVLLDATWREVMRRQTYPPALRSVLGELMAACALLAATLKFRGGALVLQIQGGGPVTLLVVECQSDLSLRATAKWDGDLDWLGTRPTLRGLTSGGRCAITIDPGTVMQCYQGIVPLEGTTTAEVLERYMARSEQIETRLVLAADENRAGGILVQKLPERAIERVAHEPALWQEAALRLDAVTTRDLLERPGSELLRRLFHEENLRGFESLGVRFGCRCSRDTVRRVIRMLGPEEAYGILADRGEIEVTCEFCKERYVFDAAATEDALGTSAGPRPS